MIVAWKFNIPVVVLKFTTNSELAKQRRLLLQVLFISKCTFLPNIYDVANYLFIAHIFFPDILIFKAIIHTNICNYDNYIYFSMGRLFKSRLA